MTNKTDVFVNRLFAVLYLGIAVSYAFLGGAYWLFAVLFLAIAVAWFWVAQDKAKYLREMRDAS